MAERFLIFEGRRPRSPKFAFRAVRPDGTAVHALRLAEGETMEPGATVVADCDAAIQAVLRQAGYGGR